LDEFADLNFSLASTLVSNASSSRRRRLVKPRSVVRLQVHRPRRPSNKRKKRRRKPRRRRSRRKRKKKFA